MFAAVSVTNIGPQHRCGEHRDHLIPADAVCSGTVPVDRNITWIKAIVDAKITRFRLH